MYNLAAKWTVYKGARDEITGMAAHRDEAGWEGPAPPATTAAADSECPGHLGPGPVTYGNTWPSSLRCHQVMNPGQKQTPLGTGQEVELCRATGSQLGRKTGPVGDPGVQWKGQGHRAHSGQVMELGTVLSKLQGTTGHQPLCTVAEMSESLSEIREMTCQKEDDIP